MFHIIILGIVPLTVCGQDTQMDASQFQLREGPGGMEYTDLISCDDFVKNSKFNPYSVIGGVWITFYFWAPYSSHPVLAFIAPTKKERNYMKQLFQNTMSQPVNWTARHVIMRDYRENSTSLLVERSIAGYYWLFEYVRTEPGVQLDPLDIRFKQTGDGKYLAIMHCERDVVYILARKKDIPDPTKIQDEIAKFGYRGRGGMSYLYQGHSWMPIPEMEPHDYWARKND